MEFMRYLLFVCILRLSLCLELVTDSMEIYRDEKTTQNPSFYSLFRSEVLRVPADADLPITKLIPKYGYPLEVHKVQTADGYVLSIHRIPHGRGLKTKTFGDPVLLFHGIMSSSDDWVVIGPNHSLGYILADEGYDVWLANARGNKHSRQHANLSVDDYEFWNFSFEEIGLYDLPAIIDYILRKRNVADLFYIGHSQGTTAFYVMSSMRLEYNKRIKMMYSLSPCAWLSNIYNPITKALTWFSYPFTLLQYYLSMGKMPMLWSSELSGTLCSERAPTQPLCPYAIANLNEIDNDTLPVILAHYSGSASVKQIIHYGQIARSGNFQRYDFGRSDNYAQYGQAEPPSYNVSNIAAPVYLMYSDYDRVTVPTDIEILYQRLPNVAGVYRVPAKFDHNDFLWAKSAKFVVYNVIIDSMKKYKPLK